MLTHTGAHLNPQSSGRRDTAGAANAHLAVIRHFGMYALVVLLAGGAAGGVIALKSAIFLWAIIITRWVRDRLYRNDPRQRRWGRSKRRSGSLIRSCAWWLTIGHGRPS